MGGPSTVAGEDLGLGARGLADEDGDVGVVALHGRVRPGQERPVCRERIPISLKSMQVQYPPQLTALSFPYSSISNCRLGCMGG